MTCAITLRKVNESLVVSPVKNKLFEQDPFLVKLGR